MLSTSHGFMVCIVTPILAAHASGGAGCCPEIDLHVLSISKPLPPFHCSCLPCLSTIPRRGGIEHRACCPRSFEGLHLVDLAAAIESDIDKGTIPGAVFPRKRQLSVTKLLVSRTHSARSPWTKTACFAFVPDQAITATAAMILWERGQLGLDDPVSLYLPEFADIGVEFQCYPQACICPRSGPSPFATQ